MYPILLAVFPRSSFCALATSCHIMASFPLSCSLLVLVQMSMSMLALVFLLFVHLTLFTSQPLIVCAMMFCNCPFFALAANLTHLFFHHQLLCQFLLLVSLLPWKHIFFINTLSLFSTSHVLQ